VDGTGLRERTDDLPLRPEDVIVDAPVLPHLSRRGFLVVGAATAATAGATALPGVPALAAARRRTVGDPFTLGVASGDPTPDGVVLWTRLAVDPLAEDGHGGMPSRDLPVQWELATDQRMRNIVRRGTTTARRTSAHAVHVLLHGLEPGREYHYRFRTGAHVSPLGRTRTAPHPRSAVPFTMAVASCAQYEHGWFTAYRRLAQDQPDLVLHLGDYFYEYEARDYVVEGGNVRDHAGPETTTLAGYRQRHAQYKADLDLQTAHAVAPWIPVWDDHELDNNWADEIPEDEQTRTEFLARRRAAFQAYYENMPLRPTSKPAGIDLQLYRRLRWGRLTTFHMLDTRQYRSDQACGDGWDADCAERLDPARSITGRRQERWLLDGLAASDSTWDVLGQQVFFAQRDRVAGPGSEFSMDGWDGYKASRDRILRGMRDRAVQNPVVLTGDVHTHWANELKADFDDPGSPTVGVELVTSSITSGQDGADEVNGAETVLPENPHIKFASNRRGYVRAHVTAREMHVDFRSLLRVSQPGAPAYTQASFTVEAGEPGLQPVAPRA
jgi:alkaline phosphatase D